MRQQQLTRRTPENVSLEIKDPVDPLALSQAKAILDEVRDKSSGSVDSTQLIQVAKRLGDIPEEAKSFIVSKEMCKAAYEELSEEDRRSLTNIYNRVKVFAEAQRKSVVDVEIPIPGGKAGHTVSPCRGMFFGLQKNSSNITNFVSTRIRLLRCNGSLTVYTV